MDKENLAFLQDSLKYLGFGENTLLNQHLEEQVLKDVGEFELYTEAFFDDNTKLEAKLYYRKSDSKDRYFLTKFDALLRYSDDPDRNRAQTFYIYKGTGITFKEAFNLLEGRAVNKDMTNLEGEKYNAWVQLNFEEKDMQNNFKLRQFRAQYHYELDKVLEKYPIRELQSEETKAVLIRSLRRGNVQLVTFLKLNKTEKMFIEANPMYKTINIYSLATRAARKQGTGKPSEVENPVAPIPDPTREETPEEDGDPLDEPTGTRYPSEKQRLRPDRVHLGLPKATTRKGVPKQAI
jgi:hypothetical protein